MPTVAKIGHGAQFWLDNAGGVLTKVAEITAIAVPDETAEVVESSHFESPGKRREYIAGMIEGGEGEIAMNYAPESATSALIAAAIGATRDYEIILPTAAGTWEINGECVVLGRGRDIPIDDRMVQTLRVKWSGAPTEAAGA